MRIRPPRQEEFGACRMLLASDSGLGLVAQYLLAVQDDAPYIVGAAAYITGIRFTRNIRIRVIRTHRRQGIGSRLLDHIIEIATQKGNMAAGGYADSVTEPDAAPFVLSRGFTLANRLTKVHGTMQSGMKIILPLADRLRRSGMAPEGARIVRLCDAPRNAVVELYVAELARSPLTTPWALLDELYTSRFANSPVLLAGDRIAGFLLWGLEGDLATIPARIVAPEFQGGATNVLLMEDALRTGWDAGARDIEFDIPQNNSDTEKLARRFDTHVVRTSDNYFRKLTS